MEADIIAVKIPLGDPELKLFYKQSGGEVPWARQFADGVLYCLRTAKDLGKPVVINMSFGDDASAGDGLDDDSRFIDSVLDPGGAAGDNAFPTGALIVKAAGNEGEAWSRMARITVPAAGQIVVPFRLVDQHGTGTSKRNHCRRWRYKPSPRAFFWYRRPAAPLAVAFAVRSPHQTGFWRRRPPEGPAPSTARLPSRYPSTCAAERALVAPSTHQHQFAECVNCAYCQRIP